MPRIITTATKTPAARKKRRISSCLFETASKLPSALNPGPSTPVSPINWDDESDGDFTKEFLQQLLTSHEFRDLLTMKQRERDLKDHKNQRGRYSQKILHSYSWRDLSKILAIVDRHRHNDEENVIGNETRMILLRIILFLQECNNQNIDTAAVIITDSKENENDGDDGSDRTRNNNNCIAIELLTTMKYRHNRHVDSDHVSSSSMEPVIRVSHAVSPSYHQARSYLREIPSENILHLGAFPQVLWQIYNGNNELFVGGSGALVNFIEGCGLLDVHSNLEIHEGILVVPDSVKHFVKVQSQSQLLQKLKPNQDTNAACTRTQIRSQTRTRNRPNTASTCSSSTHTTTTDYHTSCSREMMFYFSNNGQNEYGSEYQHGYSHGNDPMDHYHQQSDKYDSDNYNHNEEHHRYDGNVGHHVNEMSDCTSEASDDDAFADDDDDDFVRDTDVSPGRSAIRPFNGNVIGIANLNEYKRRSGNSERLGLHEERGNQKLWNRIIRVFARVCLCVFLFLTVMEGMFIARIHYYSLIENNYICSHNHDYENIERETTVDDQNTYPHFPIPFVKSQDCTPLEYMMNLILAGRQAVISWSPSIYSWHLFQLFLSTFMDKVKIDGFKEWVKWAKVVARESINNVDWNHNDVTFS